MDIAVIIAGIKNNTIAVNSLNLSQVEDVVEYLFDIIAEKDEAIKELEIANEDLDNQIDAMRDEVRYIRNTYGSL